MRPAGLLILAFAAVLVPVSLVFCAFPSTVIPLERAFPLNQRVELSELRARDRIRHARILQGVMGGVVDFSVEGSSDLFLVGLYFTKVKLGSPPREFNVQIDTGSDILWVTCSSCSDCPKSSGLGVELHFFDTASSSTAGLVSCSDPVCDSRIQTTATQCFPQSNQCGYSFQYGDGSGTSGYYVTDKLYFDAILGQSVVANSSAFIVFGCSNYQSGDLTKTDKAVDGIFGFGQGALSVISQLSARGITPRVFSHCLKGADSGGGILVLGEILEPSLVYSPLVPSQPHYNLNLQSIAVNGQLLPINPAAFATSNNRGTIIDTGTTLAYLVEEAYDPFISAITASVSQLVTPTISKGYQCYLVPSSIEIFPPVSLNFAGGASMVLKPEEYLIHLGFYDGAALWCIGFEKIQGGVTILGAMRAIKVKNHTQLNGKMIRVTWSHRDPNARKSGVGNIFVKNLSESINNAGLQDMFEKFGTIISCKVATFEDGKSKGYGFVQFEFEDSANAAIEKLNGSTIHDKQLYVGKFMKKSDRVLPSPDATYTNLYVKNLDPEVTEELLQEKFSEFGKIVSLVLAKDDDGASRGFGFVNFESSDDAKRALEVMNGSQLGSKILYVSKAQKKAEREQILRRRFEEKRNEQFLKSRGSNVYVKNVDDDITDEELKQRFSQCGAITSAKLMRDDKGISKGFGFVCFSTPEEASKAVSTFHGHMFHRKPLYVAIAQRKEERHAQLQLQYVQRMAGLAAGTSTTVIPSGYPPLYYTAPSSVLSHVHPRPGLMYQPFGLRPGWRGNGFAPPTRPALQPSTLPVMPNTSRQNRQNRGRINGHMFPQTGAQTVSYVPHIQQSTQSLTSSKDLNSQQRFGPTKYVANGRPREMSKGSSTVSNTVGIMSQGSEMLSSMLAAALPEQQKQILGERLYPLVEKRQPDLVAKITGMLLEMDNSELLLLLESPDSLATKVEEAVEVLKLSQTKVSGQDVLHPSYLSAEVTVN